jgi:DMSO/TMAO reductase YedYZ heme-binding membrane subunit
MKVVEALVPFILSRSFQTTLGFNMGFTVALGIIAFYGMVILIFTSQFRSKMSPKVWRGIHYLSSISYLLFVAHGFMTGTDSPQWWMRALYATSISIVFFLVLIRVLSRNFIPSVRLWWKSRKEGGENLPLENRL